MVTSSHHITESIVEETWAATMQLAAANHIYFLSHKTVSFFDVFRLSSSMSTPLKVLSLPHCPFFSLSRFLFSFFLFFTQIQFKHGPPATEIYTFFFSLDFSFLSSKHRLYSQHANFLASSVINNSIYLLQSGIDEQKYTSLYFLSGVVYDESDKFHHYHNESHLSVHVIGALISSLAPSKTRQQLTSK
ncbi:unnamed protein product [Acanthosepion pharaonis]|uniref:Uncharacterized protein n=1 Tax=Acanthosepion pharaonis TaxID=158019 RepID=A0A812CBU1_ACAPH|nr:unnamed protein product [Sepia pharaonis]